MDDMTLHEPDEYPWLTLIALATVACTCLFVGFLCGLFVGGVSMLVGDVLALGLACMVGVLGSTS